MPSVKEAAVNYESPNKMKIISYLAEVPVNAEILEKTFDKSGPNGVDESFTVKYIEVNGESYRVPLSVLRALQMMLEDNPKMEKFKVRKSGSGLETNYTVVPLL
jgi:hypothetical protein